LEDRWAHSASRSLCVMLNSARRFSGGLFCTLLIATLLLAVPASVQQKSEQSNAPGTQDLFVTINGIRRPLKNDSLCGC
jgi:hypothetical protein